ncbi:MAG: hypothetical protein ACJAWS_000596 [Oleiphilaceae bacterium]|jgi:hypothetical protein
MQLKIVVMTREYLAYIIAATIETAMALNSGLRHGKILFANVVGLT